MEGILAIVFIFGGGSMFLLAISPVGKAIAARIQSQSGGSNDQLRRVLESHETVLEELEHVRQDVVELQERVDFTERLLARHRDQGQLPPSSQAEP